MKTDRGYVLFPPSIHPTGAVYEIIDHCDPAQAPEWLLKRIAKPQVVSRKTTADVDTPKTTKFIEEGNRNSAITSVAGWMHHRGMSPKVIEAAMLTMNEEKFRPPLPLEEVEKVVNGLTNRYEPGENVSQQPHLIIGERPNAAMVHDAEAILRNQEEERIFHNTVSRRLVRVIQHREQKTLDHAVKRAPEARILADVDAQYLRLALGRSGRVFKEGKFGLVPADAPRDLTEMILSSVRTSPEKTSWLHLRKISQTPILLADATIVSEPGYHADSRVWIDTRGVNFIDPAAAKPKLSAAECRRLIEANIYPFVSEYPFLREMAGQHWYETGAFAVVLSALMSIDDRHNLPAVPMHCVSAPLQSCGKTRLVEAICASCSGNQPTIVTYDGAEEFGKHLPVLLGKGDSAICLDNVIMPVNNAKLAALLTQEYAFNNRILGKSEDVTLENVSVLFATGVNLQLSGDMPTRCLLIRIEPEDERPEQRRFPFDQVERAKKLFPQAVMAIKAMLRAHQLHGFPGTKTLKNASRFPTWDKRVRAAIIWAGYADPIITQEAIRSDDPVRTENLRVLWILREKFKDEPFLTCNISTRLLQDSLEVLKQITGHKDGEALNERKVGKYFSHNLVGRWFEGIRLVKTGKTPGGRHEWRVEAKLDVASFCIEEEPL